jgi:hypothetical protein
MTYYSMKEYIFLNFEPSKRQYKKYKAVLQHTKDYTFRYLHFGDTRYQQYKDTTNLGLYSHLDHMDRKRRQSYHTRHRVFIKKEYYSPGYFSMKYLW